MRLSKLIFWLMLGLLLVGGITGCKRKLIPHVPSKVALVSVMDTLPGERGAGVLFHHYKWHTGEIQTSTCEIETAGLMRKLPEKAQIYRYVGESLTYSDDGLQVTALYVQDVCLEVRYLIPSGLTSADETRLEALNGLDGAQWKLHVTPSKTNWVDAVSGNIKFIGKDGSLVLRAQQYNELRVVSKDLQMKKR